MSKWKCTILTVAVILHGAAFGQDPLFERELKQAQMLQELEAFNRAIEPEDPYSKGASAGARIREALRRGTRISVWSAHVRPRGSNDQRLVPFQELLAARIGPDRFKIMEEVFAERRKQAHENYMLVSFFAVEDTRQQMQRHGLDAQIIAAFGQGQKFAPQAGRDFETCYRDFVRAEREAEEEFAAKIFEVLSPAELDDFIGYFTSGPRNIVHPLFVLYLGLTPEQTRRMEADITELLRLGQKLRTAEVRDAEAKGRSLPSPPAYLFDEEYIKAYVKPLSHLTPEQFRILAPRISLMKENETLAQYRDRLDAPRREILLDLLNRGVEAGIE